MRLLDAPYSRQEKHNQLDMLHGCICRLSVSDDPVEVVRMLGFANDYLSMVAQSRIMELLQKEAADETT